MVQAIINNTASFPPVVHLLRHLVLACLRLNCFVSAVHVPGIDNSVADVFSFPVGQILSIGAGCEATQYSLPRAAVECCIATSQFLIRKSVSAATWTAYSKVWQ